MVRLPLRGAKHVSVWACSCVWEDTRASALLVKHLFFSRAFI